MKFSDYIKLAVAIAVSELAGIIGAAFTTPSIQTWYAGLIKPVLNPPSWIFGPVWTTLYLLMGVAAFIVWRKGLNKKEIKVALAIFLFQLILNSFWSIVFFGWHNLALALAEIMLLCLTIIANIIIFYKISKPAAWLLIPYILWVSFAVYLTFSFWMLN